MKKDWWIIFLCGVLAGLLLSSIMVAVAKAEEVDYWFKESAPTMPTSEKVIEFYCPEPIPHVSDKITTFEFRLKALEDRVKKLEENRIHIDLGSGVSLQLEWIKEDPKIQYNLEGCR